MEAAQRVLIIDDDPAYVQSTGLVLEAKGYEVDSASSGEEGLSKIRQQRPDLVLLDIMMDWVLDGVQVTREMLRQKELLNIPIIIVSSIVDSEYRDMFPQDEYLHCDSWLDKPCPPDKLLGEMNRILSRYGRKE
ncbi:MAG: hypothetical protein AMJ93_04065 [Anaerolineae bacterium SM23_84]|nr:MAG: hypothetical protein AMJ93_04065 [Anaerolineae bacterium SM23_84]